MAIKLRSIIEYPEPKEGDVCIVECWDWTPCGYAVASYENGSYMTDTGDDITEYVTSYYPIE